MDNALANDFTAGLGFCQIPALTQALNRADYLRCLLHRARVIHVPCNVLNDLAHKLFIDLTADQPQNFAPFVVAAVLVEQGD